MQFRKEFVTRTANIEFTPQCGQLHVIQLMALGIGQQPIQASRNVTQMKCHWRKPQGPCEQFLFR